MKTLAAIALSLSAAAVANAAIIGTTGMCVQVVPPPVANFPNIVNPLVEVWNEQSNVPVSAGVFADMTTNPSTSVTPVPGTVFGLFNSHFMHWSALPPAGGSGTVTFDGTILAVMFSDTLLDLSDPTFGSFGTVYPTLQPQRGLNIPTSFISILGNTLTFQFGSSTAGVVDVEQVRVLTRPVPTPGAAALLGLGSVCLLRRRR